MENIKNHWDEKKLSGLILDDETTEFIMHIEVISKLNLPQILRHRANRESDKNVNLIKINLK